MGIFCRIVEAKFFTFIPEADPDPNQRGGRDLLGGAETISGVGAEGEYTISGGACAPPGPPLDPPLVHTH